MIDPRDTDPLHVEEDRRVTHDRRYWRWIACAVAVIAALSFLAGRTSATPRSAPQLVVPAIVAERTGAPRAAAGVGTTASGGAPTSAPAAALPPSPATSGIASWYAANGLIAAAGPGLRTGDWRGRLVTVTAGGRSVTVMLSDWCACRRRLIDLSDDAFARLAPLSVGLLRVTVERGGPSVTPPPTDVQP